MKIVKRFDSDSELSITLIADNDFDREVLAVIGMTPVGAVHTYADVNGNDLIKGIWATTTRDDGQVMIGPNDETPAIAIYMFDEDIEVRRAKED